MNNLKKFYTKIKGNWNSRHDGKTVKTTDYIVGFVRGIQYAYCDSTSMIVFASARNKEEEYTVLASVCTEENYQKFITAVEERFPNLCEFHYDYDGDVVIPCNKI